MFTLELERYDNISVVRFHGDMTLASAVALRQHLEEMLKATKSKDLALDLADVQQVDNSGLGALVGACTRARSWGKRLILFRPPSHVQCLLDTLEISGFFPILEDEHDLTARQFKRD